MSNLSGLSAVFSNTADQLEAIRVATHNEKVLLARKRDIKCPHCGRGSFMENWNFIKGQEYVPSPGYVDGEYHKAKGSDSCFVVCQKCSTSTQVKTHPQRGQIVNMVENPYGVALEEIFRAVEDITSATVP